jgi:NADH-quinone oxidoreductase subunit G
MVGDGPMQDGDEAYRASGPPVAALVSQATAGALGVAEGGSVRLAGPAGSVVLPVAVSDLHDHVVWAPSASGGVHLRRDLGVGPGDVLTLEAVR